MAFAKPCLDCGALTRAGNRCEKHQAIIDSKINARKAQRTLYDSDYKKQAKLIKQFATHCWLCNEPFTDRSEIQADHVLAGNKDSMLMPAHARCNASRGNKPISDLPEF
jgi:hypothetical protein